MKKILVVLLFMAKTTVCICSSLEEENILQSYNKAKQLIEEEGYNDKVYDLLKHIAKVANPDQLSSPQLVTIAEFLKEDNQYEQAALWYIKALKKGIYDRYIVSYLSMILEEKGIKLSEVLKADDQQTLKIFVEYWEKEYLFEEKLLREESTTSTKKRKRSQVDVEFSKNADYSALDIARYFLSKNKDSDLTNLKIQHLCSYAQGHYLARYKKPLFRESIEAWTYGPVIREVYFEYNKYGSSIIPSISVDKSKYSDEVRECLNKIYKQYGKFAAWKLSEMSREESYWKSAVRETEIPLELIMHCFIEKDVDF